MQRFLQDRNVLLYRRLRNPSTGETERRTIIKLLVEQMDKLKMSEDQQDRLGRARRRVDFAFSPSRGSSSTNVPGV